MSPTSYNILPTASNDAKSSCIHQKPQHGSVYSRFLKALIVVAILLVMICGSRLTVIRPFAKSAWWKCYGGYRNQSTATLSTLSGLPTHFTLPSGDKIPSVALGCWKSGRGEVGNAVTAALSTGYKHIDGAWIYHNEEEVGDVLKKSSVPRKDLWLTSKLWNSFHAPEDVELALDDSLAKLGTDYLDLYLVHWPIAFKKDGKPYDEALTADPYPTWQKLEELVEKGKIKNIGISNFNVRRIQNLTANPLKIQPAVNQVELNFWNPQPELVKWARKKNLLLEAYSPLGSNDQVKASLSVPEVKEISDQLGISPAQVLISWQVQRGNVVLPKSVHANRIQENYQLFKLPEDLFDKLEGAAAAHKPERVVNPSKDWNLSFDIFDN